MRKPLKKDEKSEVKMVVSEDLGFIRTKKDKPTIDRQKNLNIRNKVR